MATNNLDFQNFFSTVLSSTITATDTTLYLNTLPTPSEGYLVIEPDSDTAREIIYYTSKGANYVTCPSVATGRGVGGTSATSHSSGATVQRNVVAEDLREVQNGNSNTGMHTYFDESFADYVLSGGVISGATGLIASVSSGVAYINGRRLTFNGFSKTLTASKDTYFDLIETDGSNLATISYTELASGATGSVPVSNGMHIGMVRSNASLLATIYQSGKQDVADSLGYPLYNQGATQRLLAYKEILADFSGTTNGGSGDDITGLSATVVLPVARRLRITVSGRAVQSSATGGSTVTVRVLDGSTEIGRVEQQVNTSAYNMNPTLVIYTYASAGTHVYKANLVQSAAGTQKLLATATAPGFIAIEAV